MSLTTEQQLSPNAKALFVKARQANDIGNHGYVIQLMENVLKEAPGFLDGRKLVRAAAVAQSKGKKSGFSLAGTTLGITAASTLKKDPAAAMALAEKTLASDPFNAQGNQLLFDAAQKAGFPEIAAFALETLVGANPKHTKLMHQLATHYLSMGENDKAVAVYTRIAQINPTDLDAIKKSKDASATATMKKGGWEQVAQSGGSMNFRDLMKSQSEAVALENKSKVVRTADQISQQIAETYGQWESQQSNVDLSRRLANLYEQFHEVVDPSNPEQGEEHLDTAIWYYTHTNSILNGGDPNIARKCSDLEARKVDRRIKVLEDWLTTVEDQTHPEAAPYVEELQNLKQGRDASVIETARKRVADNPTDLQLRYELGEALMKAGQVSDAIPELQRAQQNPNARLRAMNLLGQCFSEKGMLDLAVSRFKLAASEIIAMDTTKKEILYRLGLVYEKQGHREEYLNCMKEIYEADYGYLDVAKRVEASYGG